MAEFSRDQFGQDYKMDFNLDDFKSRLDKIVDTVPANREPIDFELDIDRLMRGEESDYSSNVKSTVEYKDHDTFENVVGLNPTTELERFVDGFSGLSGNYQALEAIVADIKTQTREMGIFSQSLKNQAVKNAGIAAQVDEYKAEVADLRRIAAMQSSSLEEIEAELAKKTATLSVVLADFRKATIEAEDLKSRVDSLSTGNEKLNLANEQLLSQLAERKSAYERALSEVESLRVTKNEATSDLRAARQEVSDTKCKLAELQTEYEKASAHQENLIADHGKMTEERRQLRRKIAAIETELAENIIKSERLSATNADLVGRLQTEKFSMNKAYEALVSEFTVAKQRMASQSDQVELLSEKLEVEQAVRTEATENARKNARALEESRRELSRANLAISELNLRHSTDRLTLDQFRDENIELRNRIAKLQNDNSRLQDLDTDRKTAELQAARLAEQRQKDGKDRVEDGSPMMPKPRPNENYLDLDAVSFKRMNFDD